MSIVAEQYEFVIGVDTHAATHTLSVITAATGAVIDQAVFSTTPSGLDRALTWITRHVDEHAALVVIEGVGSYGAGLTGRVVNAGLTVVEPASMAAAQRRAVGKTDAKDAVRIARSVGASIPRGCGYLALRGRDRRRPRMWIPTSFRRGISPNPHRCDTDCPERGLPTASR